MGRATCANSSNTRTRANIGPVASRVRFFHIWNREITLKTVACVDGYNLYYGCLKHTRDKWLDLYKLLGTILKAQNPTSELIQIKFFTADIKTKVASHGKAAGEAQQATTARWKLATGA